MHVSAVWHGCDEWYVAVVSEIHDVCLGVMCVMWGVWFVVCDVCLCEGYVYNVWSVYV